MKFCFVISCHNRIQESLAHLDILKFYPFEHGVIFINSGPEALQNKVYDHHYVYIKPEGHSLGALLALTEGIRTAHRLGYSHVCFRNGDDWCFRYGHVLRALAELENGKKVGGYNWFGKGNMNNFALNELFLDVKSFIDQNLTEWDRRFRNHRHINCETFFAQLVHKVVTPQEFFRFAERETSRSIGMALNNHGDNNRWFFSNWQLIGSHDDRVRRILYRKLRPLIPYATLLEAMPHFRAWLHGNPNIVTKQNTGITLL